MKRSGEKVKVLFVFALSILLGSCIIDYVPPPIPARWTIYLTAAGTTNSEKKIYYLAPDKFDAGGINGAVYPVHLINGGIFLDYLSVNGSLTGQNISLSWHDNNSVLIECSGTVNGNEMTGQWKKYQNSSEVESGTWTAVKKIDDVVNGRYQKYPDTGKTHIYSQAATVDANRVYITADFISGEVDLVRCIEEGLGIYIWEISNSQNCSSFTETYYEFETTSSPLVVRTHIIKPSGEVVLEKTITYGY